MEDKNREQIREGWSSMFNGSGGENHKRILLSVFDKYGLPKKLFRYGLSEAEAKKPQERQAFSPQVAMANLVQAGVNRDAAVAVAKYCREIVHNIEQGNGMLLWGPNGTGKTCLAVISAVKFLQTKVPRYGFDYETEDDMPAEFQAGFVKSSTILNDLSRSKLFGEYYERIEYLKNVGFLIVDDLSDIVLRGKDEFTRQEFSDLMRTRFDNNLITVFTSNMTKDEIKEAGSNTLLDSIAATTYRIHVPGRIRELLR